MEAGISEINLPDARDIPFTLIRYPGGDEGATVISATLLCTNRSRVSAISLLRNIGTVIAKSGDADASNLESLDSLLETTLPTRQEQELVQRAQQAALHELQLLSNSQLSAAVEMHEQVHVTIDHSHLDKMATLTKLLAANSLLYSQIDAEISPKELERFSNLLQELTILDEAIATFHTLVGQRVIGKDQELDAGVSRFFVINRLTEVFAGFGSNRLAIISVAEIEDEETQISTIAPEPNASNETCGLTCEVVDYSTDFETAMNFVFDRKNSQTRQPVEYHIAATILLFQPEFISKSDELPLCTFPPFYINNHPNQRIIRNLQVFIDYPDEIFKLLTPQLYDELVAKYNERQEALNEVLEKFIQVIS